MAFIPEILPADPRAPERVRHRKMPLRYGLIGKLIMALDVAYERRDLASLDDHILRDIGLTRDDVRHESRRSFWDLAEIQRTSAKYHPLPGTL